MACCLVAELYLTLCDHMDCSPPGSSVHGISQARTLQWVAVSSGDLPSPGIESLSPGLAGAFFPTEPPGKPKYVVPSPFRSCYLHTGTHALYLNLTPCFSDVGQPWGKFIALFDYHSTSPTSSNFSLWSKYVTRQRGKIELDMIFNVILKCSHKEFSEMIRGSKPDRTNLV